MTRVDVPHRPSSPTAESDEKTVAFARVVPLGRPRQSSAVRPPVAPVAEVAPVAQVPAFVQATEVMSSAVYRRQATVARSSKIGQAMLVLLAVVSGGSMLFALAEVSLYIAAEPKHDLRSAVHAVAPASVELPPVEATASASTEVATPAPSDVERDVAPPAAAPSAAAPPAAAPSVAAVVARPPPAPSIEARTPARSPPATPAATTTTARKRAQAIEDELKALGEEQLRLSGG
jgi:hypothetical protein